MDDDVNKEPAFELELVNFELMDVMRLEDEDGSEAIIGVVLVAEIDGQDYALCAEMVDEDTMAVDDDEQLIFFVMQLDRIDENGEEQHYYNGVPDTLRALYVMRCMQNLVQGYDEGENAT